MGIRKRSGAEDDKSREKSVNTVKDENQKQSNGRASRKRVTKPGFIVRLLRNLLLLVGFLFSIVVLVIICTTIYHQVLLAQDHHKIHTVFKKSLKGSEYVPFRYGKIFAQCSAGDKDTKIDIWLINGLGGLLTDWSYIFSVLQTIPGVRVCRFDQGSFGFSDHLDPTSYGTIGLYIDQLQHLYKHYDPNNERAKILVGHSLGGLIVRITTHLYAEKDNIFAAVLIDATTETTYELFLKPMENIFSYMFDILGALEYAGFSRLILGYGIHPMESYWRLLAPEDQQVTEFFSGNPKHWRSAKDTFLQMEKGSQWAKTVFSDNPWSNATQIRFISATKVEDSIPGLEDGDPAADHIADQKRMYQSYPASVRKDHIFAEDCAHFLHLQKPEYVIDTISELVEMWNSLQ